MGKIKVACLVIVALIVGDPAGAWSQNKAPQNKTPPQKTAAIPVVVLPIEAKGLDPTIGLMIDTAVQGQIENIGVITLPTSKFTSDTFTQLQKRKVFVEGCGSKPWCIQAVGKAFNAKAVYHLVAGKAQEGVTLTMRIFDSKTGKEMRKAVEFAAENISEIERAARWVTLKASSTVIGSLVKGKGKILVECSDASADLYINGKAYGKKTGKSFKVSAGVFDVQVRKEGFVPYHEVLMVKPEEEQVVKVALVRESAPAVAAAPNKPAALAPGQKAPPLSAESPKGRREDLPAWAVFENSKEAGRVSQPTGASPKQGASNPHELPAFANKPEAEKAAEEPKKENEKKFYQTWWFWTIVGAAVVGGGTAATILLLPKKETGTGNAAIAWE